MPTKPKPKDATVVAHAEPQFGVVQLSGMPDRVFVSGGLTISKGSNTYEFIRVDASLASDVRPGETTQQAYARIWDLVGAEISRQHKKMREMFPKDK